MKKFIRIMLCASLCSLVVLSTGCSVSGAASADGAVPSMTDVTNHTLGITLTAEDVTPTGLTIVCTQSGGSPSGELMTGSYYVIERYTIDGWKTVDYVYDGSRGELCWTDEAWIINMDGVTRWSMSWEWLYGELSPGWYRVGKKIMDWRGTSNYENYMCYAVFEIK